MTTRDRTSRLPVTRHPPLAARITSLTFVFALLTACASPAYYWQATTGHLALMAKRQPVAEILADPGIDPELRDRLELAQEVIDFAERELDLPAGGSYQGLVQVDGPVSWNVIATPAWSLQPKRWCFPVAGCVAYRGYFDRDKAEAFGARLARRGLDVAVLPVAAYSTLGWFDDPLLDTTLAREPAQLAGTLFHELAHQRLYVGDDTAFNEGYASFVESAGVERWLGGRADHAGRIAEWRNRQAAEASVNVLLRETREALSMLYALEPPPADRAERKSAIFERLRARYRNLVLDEWAGRDYFAGWLRPDMNNAHLVALGVYADGRCAFGALLNDSAGDFPTFHRLAAGVAQRPAAERHQWLQQPCAAVAPDPEL